MSFERKDEMRKFSDEQNLNTQRIKITETKKNTNSMSLTKAKTHYKKRERWKINRGKNYIMIISKIEEVILMLQ